MLWLRNQLRPILSTKTGAKCNFPQKPLKMFPGDKMPTKGFILRKMELGSNFRSQMSDVMAKNSTDTNFKYEEWR